MLKRKFEITFVEKDDEDNIINTTTSINYELTPDEGKAFKDPDTGELILRADNGKGAVIEISSELLDRYEEVDIKQE